ncbi:MAG: hypothetical protein IKJ60_08155 [Ruminococcus sp.]|jgi:uncharacterized protein YxjI|nr:hypothetical protein [Ruminococcus sp.]MBR3901503.1 hypothetical protein [Ruminococcus sp.]
MELMISFKNNKYIVQDKKHQRQIYTIKKKGFGAPRYVLMDPSNYQLYSFTQLTMERKPIFTISHNDVSIMQLNCKSLFLDPTINVEGKDIQGTVIKYDIASKDHRNFDIIKGDVKVGSIKTSITAAQELQYDLEIEDKMFDDYIPLFALAIDITFGEMNRELR